MGDLRSGQRVGDVPTRDKDFGGTLRSDGKEAALFVKPKEAPNNFSKQKEEEKPEKDSNDLYDEEEIPDLTVESGIERKRSIF